MLRKLFLMLFLPVLIWAQGTTTNLGLTKPTSGATGWATQINGNFDKLDAAATSISIENYGGVADSGSRTNDSTTAFNSAIAAAMTSGKALHLHGKRYWISGQITLPTVAGSPNTMKPLKIMGAGCHASGQGTAPTAGTILDMTYAGTTGKILCLGLGNLEVSGVTFIDSLGGTLPWFYSTNSTLQLHNNAFIGTKTGTACDQDAIVLGGTTETIGNSVTDGFQGYGTVIERNYFNRIRRAVYGRTWVNSVVIRANNVWVQSGSNLAGGAAFEIDNIVAASSNAGNVISDNLIEITNYIYGIKLVRAAANFITGNSGWDPGGSSVAIVRLENDAIANTIISGYAQSPLAAVSDNSQNNPRTNTVLSQDSASWRSQQFFRNTNGFEAYGGLFRGGTPGSGQPSPVTIKPDTDQINAWPWLSLIRSGASGYLPNTEMFAFAYNGDLRFRNATFTNTGLDWNATGTGTPAGASMTIDSGTGGSYLILKNLGVQVYSHNGGPLRLTLGQSADQIRFGPSGNTDVGIIAGSGSPEGAVTAPVGSLFLRRDGGAGTSLYVKQTGTGNTGWVAK